MTSNFSEDMQNFLRALRDAKKYWVSIVVATACSFAVAALWGANIGAFYPILEVTMRGQSVQQWVAAEIETGKETVANLEAKQKELEAAQALADDEASVEIQKQLVDVEQSQTIAKTQLASHMRMQPWIDNWVPSDPFWTISLIVCALVVSTLIKHVFLIANEYLVGGVALNLSRNVRQQLFSKAIHMDRGGFSQYGSGGFLAQLTHSTDMLANGLIAALGAAIREPLKMLSCLIGAGIICWRLLLMSVIIAPIVGTLLYIVTKKIKGISRGILGKATSFHEVMHESLGNINTVQAYQREKCEEDRFGDATLMMRNFGLKFIFYSSLAKPIIEFLGIGMLGTTIIGGAYLVLNNETHLFGIKISDQPLSESALLVFFGMLIGASDPLRKLSAVYSSIHAGSIAADAVFSVLDRENLIVDPVSPQMAPSPHKNLCLERVIFGYDAEHPILNDVSLEIPFGETVAIVGHNGSGKSTLINLLCRFYDPQAGRLTFDGVDIKDMKVHDVRRRIALVNQQTELFNDTVSYNIRYGNPNATDEQIREVAVQSHAHEFIESVLENGYETIVGQNGGRLSGGQRQRIALARALLCDPEVLILDEATSQIDMQSEQLIRESLAAHRGERTMVIITHREKLLELADRIFEVRNGQLVQIENPHRAAA